MIRLLVVGDLVTDVVAVLSAPPALDTDTPARIRVTGGGQAANTAAWLAWAARTGPGSASARVTLVASAGDDESGDHRVAEMVAAGVRCAVSRRPGMRTGAIVVLASGQQRTMVTDRGASLALSPADVDAALDDAPDARHLHLSAYALLDPESRDAGLRALAGARERGMTTSVDAASAAPLRRVGAGRFLDWVRGTDLLLANRDEATILVEGLPGDDTAGTDPPSAVHLPGASAAGTDSPPAIDPSGDDTAGTDPKWAADAASRDADRGDPPPADAGVGQPARLLARRLAGVTRVAAVVKRGPEGAVWAGADGTLAEESAVPANVVDATGAGDAFAAGLLLAWTAGAAPGEALRAGTRLGALAVARVGARPVHRPS